MKVCNITWNPNSDSEFASVGSKHLAVYTLNGKKVEKKQASGSKTGNTNMCCVSWLKDKKYAGQLVAGGSDGKVYLCNGSDVKSDVKNGKGSVHSVCSANDPAAGGEVVLVGGNDKTLNAYSIEGKGLSKSPIWTLAVDSPPRSIDVFNGNVLMGYKNGSLTVMPYTKDGKASPQVIMTSHCDGEVWGL